MPEINHITKQSPIDRFRAVVKKVQGTIAAGGRDKKVLLLDKSYWLEAVGMKIVVDTTLFEGHVYTGYLISEGTYFTDWLAFQKIYSFEEYVNSVAIPSLSQKERDELKAKLSVVEYYSQKQLAKCQISFDSSGNIQNSPPDNSYMFILDHKNRLYITGKQRGRINHTSLSHGKAVKAAGGMKIKDGKIVAVDAFSGHYKPTLEHMQLFLDYLQKNNVDTSSIELTYIANYQVQPWDIRKIKADSLYMALSN